MDHSVTISLLKEEFLPYRCITALPWPPLSGMPRAKQVGFHSCTPVLTVAVVTTVKSGNRPTCPSTDEEIWKRPCCLYAMECYSHTEGSHVTCRKMDGTEGHRVKLNKPDLDKCPMFTEPKFYF